MPSSTPDFSIESEQTQTPKLDDNHEIDFVISLNEVTNSFVNSSSSTTTALPRDVPSSKYEFQTHPPKFDQQEYFLLNLKRLRGKIAPVLFDELENLLKAYKQIFR